MVNSRDFLIKSYDSFSSTDVSYKNEIPPWCSSIALLMSNEMPRANLITKVISRDKFMTLLGIEESRAEKCCHRIIYLTTKLSRVEYALRYKIRHEKSSTILSNTYSAVKDGYVQQPYIQGVTAIKGSDTKEWSGRVALWGIVPLWKATPPIDTIIALRRTTPTDCWPFSGRRGEVIINLPHTQTVTYASVEHIRPDTAKSAPKNFVIYGILSNDTRIKLIHNQYESQGPAKQFYPIGTQILLKRIVFRILTNQGNQQYTCLYRFHVYGILVQILWNNMIQTLWRLGTSRDDAQNQILENYGTTQEATEVGRGSIPRALAVTSRVVTHVHFPCFLYKIYN